MGWTVDTQGNLFWRGEMMGTVESVADARELMHRLDIYILSKTMERGYFGSTYSDEDQERYVYRILQRQQRRTHLPVPRGILTLLACRSYRGINAKVLDQILERLEAQQLVVVKCALTQSVTTSKRSYSRQRLQRTYKVSLKDTYEPTPEPTFVVSQPENVPEVVKEYERRLAEVRERLRKESAKR